MKPIYIVENGVVHDYSHYLCSESGDIVNTRTGRSLKWIIDKDGYAYTRLNDRGKSKFFRIHRIVAYLYCENSNPKTNVIVHHIDNNPLNNCYQNLMWTTISYNTKEGYRIGNAYTKGERHSQAKLTEDDVRTMCAYFKTRELSIPKIAKLYNVSPSTISMISARKNWTHITKDIDF